MLTWLSANLINIALIAAIVLITALLIRGMIRDKKAGKPSCGCSCTGCASCGGCALCAAAKSAKSVSGGSSR